MFVRLAFGGLLLIIRSLHHDEPGGEHGKSGNLESLRLAEHVLFLRRFWKVNSSCSPKRANLAPQKSGQNTLKLHDQDSQHLSSFCRSLRRDPSEDLEKELRCWISWLWSFNVFCPGFWWYEQGRECPFWAARAVINIGIIAGHGDQ